MNVLSCSYAKKAQQNSELFSAVSLCPPGFLSTSVLLNILLNTGGLSEVSADVSSSPFCLALACYQAAFCLPWSADTQSEAGSAVRRSRLAPGTRPGSPHQTRPRASGPVPISLKPQPEAVVLPSRLLWPLPLRARPQPPFRCLTEDVKGLKICKRTQNHFKVYLVTNAVYTTVKI